jgi:hypothetical protein
MYNNYDNLYWYDINNIIYDHKHKHQDIDSYDNTNNNDQYDYSDECAGEYSSD